MENIDLAKQILFGMGAIFRQTGSMSFQVDSDTWRVDVELLEFDELTVSFEKNLDRMKIASISARIQALASLVGLGVAFAELYERGVIVTDVFPEEVGQD